MGHLFLINDSFELSNTIESERDIVFRNFCKAIDLIKKNKDNLYADDDFFQREYSYGTFSSFVFKSWPEIAENSNLKGIKNTTYQLYFSLIQPAPGLAKFINSKVIFDQQFNTAHHGYSGFEMQNAQSAPYICCDKSWHVWKSYWLSIHQEEIKWSDTSDDYLPNKIFSDTIFWTEIVKHGISIKTDANKDSIVNTFYEEVMKKKGDEIAAYAREIGTKVATANYYVYELELSKAEQLAAGGSLRKIFRLFGKDGKKRFISIDHKHGMFEYHDHHGKHLGEKRFDGSFNTDPDPTHNLKTFKG